MYDVEYFQTWIFDRSSIDRRSIVETFVMVFAPCILSILHVFFVRLCIVFHPILSCITFVILIDNNSIDSYLFLYMPR